MAKFGAIDFDDAILDALRDDRLVIFAGAGVSMGAPSNLASFWKLAGDIAQGTGLTQSNPLDRFLGQLHHQKIDVHTRAAQLLSPPGSAPNTLHSDLLRLFRTTDRVRLVTTNFDLHFETAASNLFEAYPKVYRAPALPRGYDFSGIVYVHGSIPDAKDLVLTDADFGRAYLTEGWARRFLVDVFRQYTVLFVGYSHDDPVMNYLARALPTANASNRFALASDEGSWNLLGITPIYFKKGTEADAFKELYDGIKQLADRTMRGALEWQSHLTQLGENPPIDEETISEIEQALREVHTTRLLLSVARNPKWLQWLNTRNYLDALFRDIELNERDKIFADWLVNHFTIEHPYHFFELITKHNLLINQHLWLLICHQIGVVNRNPIQKDALKYWINILIQSQPRNINLSYDFDFLASRCADEGCIEYTLKIFLAMTEHRINIKNRSTWLHNNRNNQELDLDIEVSLKAEHYSLDDIWINHIKPNLKKFTIPLLNEIFLRLEKIHEDLVDWDKASRESDYISYGRTAIEPHEQDKYPRDIDVLIDVARDTLEWLAENSLSALDAWIERLVASNTPLLRRLAIHAIAIHPDRSPEQRLQWLIDHIGLHELAEHHEVHRTVALNYVNASESARQTIIDTILKNQQPAFEDWSAEKTTTRSHFNWLSWLLKAKPDCALALNKLAPIKEQYPEWEPSDHLDLTHWISSGWSEESSALSVEQIISYSPADKLDELLSIQDVGFNGYSRINFLNTFRDACKQNTDWALALGSALTDKKLWESDLWEAFIQGLQEAEHVLDTWHKILNLVSNPALYSAHSYSIANMLNSLVKDGGKPFALDLIDQSNSIALHLWNAIEVKNDQDENIDDWFSIAINRTAGIIAQFWINGLSLYSQGKTEYERAMPENYKEWFNVALQDTTSKGGMARSIFTSQALFLFSLDKLWSSKHITPLFNDLDCQTFSQAWHGFLGGGRLNPVLKEALLPSFLSAIERIDLLYHHRNRFIDFLALLAVFHIPDPTIDLIPALFKNSSLDTRVKFSLQIGSLIQKLDEPSKKQLWNDWLCRYWENRHSGVPARLEDREIQIMLSWPLYLGDLFPEAVAQLVKFQKTNIQYNYVIFKSCESDLITKFQTESAKLLIYLIGCSSPQNSSKLKEIYSRLTSIPKEIRTDIDEAFVLAGILQ